MTARRSTRRKFLRNVCLSAASLPIPRLLSAKGKLSDRPNILYIMSDDHASNAVSCYGGVLSEAARTPNIDRIAAEGVRLDNCFCTNSICTPSRACILTGQYSHKNGVFTLGDRIDPGKQNVAQLLRQGGYQTAVIGKWHLKTEPAGFEHWNVLPGQGRYHNPILKEKGKGQKEYHGYSTDIITDLSLDWLKKRETAKPFFLMCHFKAPHRPWEPAERFAGLYDNMEMPAPDNLLDDYTHRSRAAANARLKIGEDMTTTDVKQEFPQNVNRNELRQWAYQRYIKDYLRCIAAVDENVGRLLNYLDKDGLTGNTIVIYTSDQGMFLGEHGYYDKRFFYEESLRMPFLLRYPAAIKPGSQNDDIIINADFAPTFLDFAGLPIPSDMQGRSFRKNLENKTPADWRSSMYYRYWMHMAHHGVPAHYGIRTKRYKLIFFYGLGLGKAGTEKYRPTDPEWELFDLMKDPYEMRNVYNDPGYKDIVKELKGELRRHKRELGDRDEQYTELLKIQEKYP